MRGLPPPSPRGFALIGATRVIDNRLVSSGGAQLALANRTEVERYRNEGLQVWRLRIHKPAHSSYSPYSRHDADTQIRTPAPTTRRMRPTWSIAKTK